MNNSLLIQTTPYCPWQDFAKRIAENQNRLLQDRFTLWHDEYSGIKSTESNNLLNFFIQADHSFRFDFHSMSDLIKEINKNPSLSIISDPRAIRSAGTLMNEIPAMTAVIFYERPDSLVSREVSNFDPNSLLKVWLASAKVILTLVRRY